MENYGQARDVSQPIRARDFTGSSLCHILINFILNSEPDTAPRDFTCTVDVDKIVVNWRAPERPNGKIIEYRINWRDSTNKTRWTKYKSLGFHSRYSTTLENVRKDSCFVVSVDAVNSVGISPRAKCSIDTTKLCQGWSSFAVFPSLSSLHVLPLHFTPLPFTPLCFIHFLYFTSSTSLFPFSSLHFLHFHYYFFPSLHFTPSLFPPFPLLFTPFSLHHFFHLH